MNRLQKKQRKFAVPARPVLLAAVLTVATQIAACRTTASVVTSVECQAFQPVLWSKKDTLRTIDQVREHNAVWTSLCDRGAGQ